MKRLFTTLLLLLTFVVSSYGQRMNVESFSMAENDMTARVHAPRRDQNGSTAALIKIETSERELAFDTGSLGIVDTDFTQVGEVWVYVPKGVIRMEVKHNLLGVLRYEFPVPILEATVYRMKLTSDSIITIVNERAQGQYFRLKVFPTDAQASLIVGDDPPITIDNGELAIRLNSGDHKYRIVSELYNEASGEITIGSERVSREVTLSPNYGYFTVNSTPSGARISINGISVGQTPYQSDRMVLGDYTIRLTAPNHGDYTTQQSLTLGGATIALSPSLVSYMSMISLSVPMSDADIAINGEVKGRGRWQGELMPGTYAVEAVRDGHRPSVMTLVVERSTPQTVTLSPPTPMYGTLDIESEQFDLDVLIDGVKVGTTPDIFSNVLAGSRTVTFSKAGFVSADVVVEITEGKITDCRYGRLMSFEESEEYGESIKRIMEETNGVFTKGVYESMGSPSELVIPYGYTSIEKGTFSASINLSSIKKGTFSGSTNLTSITLPNTITSIGEYAIDGAFTKGVYESMGSPSNLVVPNGYTSIGKGAFSESMSLRSITIPNTVTSIEGSAFSGCSNLTSITIPNSVTSIGGYVFLGCSNLTSITIPTSVTSIGVSAFSGCSSLTSITIPTSVTSIGVSAFSGCSSLTSISYPNSISAVGDAAKNGVFTKSIYESMGSPSNLVIPNGYTSIGEGGIGSSNLTSITLPNTITSIGGYAIDGVFTKSIYESMGSPSELVIPNGYTSIEKGAFSGSTNLTSITIPDSVTSIGNYAFSGCLGLVFITIPNSVTKFGTSVFNDCPRLMLSISESSPVYKQIRNAVGYSRVNTLK